ncbi:MAG: radical SAM protein, partial [Candidatus Aminicenantes bacterium]|nr:radical SAM protein [Candidatus Aminicenantes bacterium]
MGKISRRNFLRDSLIFAGSSFLLSSKYLETSTKAALEVKKTRKYPSYLELEEKGILSQRIEKLYSIYENCHLCPRDCRVDRTKGETGKCKATSKVKVSSAFPHFGEERPLVGKRGSGTI